jgi:hypothetical protein
MSEEQVFQEIFQGPLPSIVVIGFFIVVVSVAKVIGGTITGVARERTRREIAAYIAEGSMTPEQGERLMTTGGRKA